jgi:hypothetical protein
MQNLAGHPDSTRLAKSELEAAGIPVVTLAEPYGEPKAWIGGDLHGFTFRRAWYYWVVEGRMPIDQARGLYADDVGRKDVRCAGHCACPPPDEWCEWYAMDGIRLYRDQDGKQAKQWADFMTGRIADDEGEPRFVADPSQVHGARAYVTSYHVDSADGLRLLADVIRSMHSTPALAVA